MRPLHLRCPACSSRRGDRAHVAVLLIRDFPLREAPEAHRRMEDSNHIGKIILTVA